MQENLRIFTHLAVDVVRTKSSVVRVLFLATSDGAVLKLSHPDPSSPSACLVESLRPFARRTPRLHHMALHAASPSAAAASLYVTSETSVIRIGAERCSRHAGRERCLAAADPYCGWDSGRGECSPAPNKNPAASHWEQGQLECPDLSAPVSFYSSLFRGKREMFVVTTAERAR